MMQPIVAARRAPATVKIIGISTGILVLVIVLGVALYFLLRPTPQKLLTACIDTYKGIDAMSMQGNITSGIEMMGMKMNMEGTVKLKLKRPNFYYEGQRLNIPIFGSMERVTICDGKNLYVQMPFFKQTVKRDAPKDLAGIERLSWEIELETQATSGSSSAGSKDVPGITEPKLISGIDVRRGIRVLELKDKEIVSGVKCYVISVEFTDGSKQTIWMGARDRLIWKSEISYKLQSETPFGKFEVPMTASVTWTTIKVNPQFGTGEFAYKLPAGFKFVAKFERPKFRMPRAGLGVRARARSRKGLIGKPAPDWTLTSLDGRTYKLSNLRGKPVVMEFFATWCQPCREELPEMQKLWNKYRAKGLRIFGISTEPRDTVAPFVKELKLTFPVLLDADASVHNKYNVLPIPRTVFIDGKGIVREDFEGLPSPEQLSEALRKIGL